MTASAILSLGFKNSLVDTIEVMYTSPEKGEGTDIEAITATNNTTSSVSFKMYIYNSGGTVQAVLQPQTIVVRDKFSPCRAVINHTVPSGGTIRVESSAATSLEFTATGVEQ